MNCVTAAYYPFVGEIRADDRRLRKEGMLP